MKAKDLKNKGLKELLQMVMDIKSNLAKLSFELEANTLKKTSEIKRNKKDLARILTALKQLK